MWKRDNWIFGFAAIGAAAGLVKILEYFGVTLGHSGSATDAGGPVNVRPPDHTALIWALLAFAFSFGLSAYGFYLSNLRRKQASRPLAIISARWGIGGDAYKDVTDIVRKHSKPDSINLPASRGLFGDPYPNTPTHLLVDYSCSRKWDVKIPEGENLVLPEKEGQEQARVEMDRMRARLAAATRGADDPKRSFLEARAFRDLENEFNNLPWAQKIAMTLLCDGIQHELNLSRQMHMMGLGPEQYILTHIIGELRTRTLVEYKPDGTLKPNSARLRDVEEIVTNWDGAITPRV